MDEYLSQVQTDLHAVKDRMNNEKEAKQHELFKRLSQAKQKALAEKVNFSIEKVIILLFYTNVNDPAPVLVQIIK